MHDVNTVYSIPLLLHSQQVDEILLKSLNLSKVKKPNLSDWKKVVDAKPVSYTHLTLPTTPYV